MTEHKRRSRSITILSAVAAVAFFGVGAAKLIGVEAAVETFERFGFTMGFMLFIGSAEVAGAVGLFLPRLAPLAAGGLALITSGAVALHAIYDPLVMSLPAASLLVACAFLAWSRRGELDG
jgi:uncharacterized membrane protein YphA (DoxX/SURF4 family)